MKGRQVELRRGRENVNGYSSPFDHNSAGTFYHEALHPISWDRGKWSHVLAHFLH